jgi:hypothetical protein
MTTGATSLAVLLSWLLVAGPAARATDDSAAPAHGDPDAGIARQVLVTVVNPAPSNSPRAGSTPKAYAPGRYGVSTRARRSMARIEQRYGLRRIAEWPITALGVHCAVFELAAGEARDVLLTRLRSDPDVESAQPMQTFATRGGAAYDDPYFDLQRGLAAMDIEGAHQRSRGERVRVAIVDTGVDTAHPELSGRIRESVNLVDEAATAAPAEMHGTAVAGVIAAIANNGQGIVGVAPAAQLSILRACWQATDARAAVTGRCNSFTLARALGRAIDDKAAVINMSLAGPPDSLLARLLERAIELGAIVVGAQAEDPSSTDTFPASVPGVIAVRSAELARAGSGVCAPGRDVLTLRPAGGYDFANGSSLAAAQVSGIVALLRARNPKLDSRGARDLLERSHPSSGATTCLVNACAALSSMVAGMTCNGAATPPDGLAHRQK